jgi:protein involved in polysaccharide export with SLBB domain
MNLKFISIFQLLILFSLSSIAQTNLNSIKNAGVKSQQDLINLGFSQDEINQLKSDYFFQQSKDNLESKLDTVPKINEPVVNEADVSTVSKIQQDSVNVSEDTILVVYGKNAIINAFASIKENSDRIVPDANYRLGSGDRVSITIWGSAEFYNEFTLDEFGNIFSNKIGKIFLKGKTFSDAQEIITSRFSRFYDFSSSRIDINLTFSKVISVNVVGEVTNPGTYSIPSINSAFNILSLAGGVNDLGTLRNIQIVRNGKVISILDIYRFLNNPMEYKQPSLLDGDYIIVKPSKGYVEFTNGVRRPGIYEIKKDEKLTDIIGYAGGFSSTANQEQINIISIGKDALMFNSFSYDDALENDLELKFGDKINILPISSLVRGVVEVKGNVNSPGQYKFSQGDRVSDLIVNANGVNYEAYLPQAFVIRKQEDLTEKTFAINLTDVLSDTNSISNIELKEFDVLSIMDKNSFITPKTIEVSGAVNNPGILPYQQGLRLKDVILQSNGLKEEADSSKIQIERISFSSNGSGSYVETLELKIPENEEFLLKKYDKIRIRQLPEFSFQKIVSIKGEVKYPGIYSLDGQEEKIDDLIEKAGGLTDWAFLEGATLYRNKDSLGLFLVNLEKIIKNKNSKYNYILREQDEITIPRLNDFVTISGEIDYKTINTEETSINVPFIKAKRAGKYIRNSAGGYNKNGKRKSVFVVKANGHVNKSKFFGLIKPIVNKGDEIIVINKVKKNKNKNKNKKPVNWDSIINGTVTKITGIVTLIVLANSAFGN